MAISGSDDQEFEIHEDILETLFSHVPFIDLVAASHVSRAWWCAVASSLRHFNKPKPWLIVHAQAARPPYATIARAYDARSHVWIKISQPFIKYVSTLRSSDSNFLYMLSPSKFSFSFDPLHLTWTDVDSPLVWRTDPIVGRVGDSIVVAGGACDFEGDPLAVEVYNLKTGVWQACDAMPGNLKDSAASSWLSIATTDEKLFVTERESGITYWFNPETKTWSKPQNLNPGEPVSNYNIGSSNGFLILVGLLKNGENLERVKIWKVCEENLECFEIGEMPPEYVEKLKSESFGIPSLNVCVASNLVYIYNPSAVGEVAACELGKTGNRCTWWSVKNVLARDETVTDKLVFTCSEVSLHELQRAMRLENRRFELEL